MDVCNTEDCTQLVRSSGSVGVNDIEANEALSKEGFKMRIKIPHKETKESQYGLKLLWESTGLKIFSKTLINSK